MTKDHYDRLLIFMTQTGVEAGPNEISYEVTPASPSDIEDARGRWLAGFEGLPL